MDRIQTNMCTKNNQVTLFSGYHKFQEMVFCGQIIKGCTCLDKKFEFYSSHNDSKNVIEKSHFYASDFMPCLLKLWNS